MYESPIDIIYSEMQTKLEGKVFKAVQNVGINVNKDELIKALSYDRHQYEKGYADAKAEQQWIRVEYRPMDDEERKDYEETYGPLADDEAVMFDCKMPQDGQEVWACSKCGDVWQDTCQIDEGIYLEENGDWLDVVAWMPYIRPEPWKGGFGE